MRDIDELDAALSRHLDAMADHVDVGNGDVDGIPGRAGRQRRRRGVRRGGAALAGLALIAGVFTMVGGDDESPVDTIDDSEVDAGPDPKPRPVEVVPFESATPMVVGPVEAFGEMFGVQIRAGATGGEADALATSSNGIDWRTIPDVPVEGVGGIAGREDLLAVGLNRTDSVVVAAFDGVDWVESTLPAPTGARLKSLASSPTHMLALVEVPTAAELQWRARTAEAEAALRDRFGDYDSLGMGTSSGGGMTYYLSRDGETLFEGTAEEAGVAPDLLETLFDGPPDHDSAELLLYRSGNGANWQRGTSPTAVDGVDPARLVASDSEIGMTVSITDGFAHTPDGDSWTTVALDGVTGDDSVDVQHGPGYVIAATAGMVARADSVTGPYETVAAVDDTNTFLATSTGERGTVTIESTVEDSADGIDSTAEAESLGLDGDAYPGPNREHRVLASADGRNFEQVDIDNTPRSFLIPHGETPGGWIIVREQQMSTESLTLTNGYRIDPGG